MENSNQQNYNSLSVPEQLRQEGYFPIREVAEKYGYSKEHIARFLKAGRLLGKQWGSKGNWYIHEATLAEYHGRMTGGQPVQTFEPTEPVKVVETESPKLQKSKKYFFNPQLFGTLLIASGIISSVFYLSHFGILDINFNDKLLVDKYKNIHASFVSPIQQDAKHELATIWDQITNFFSDTKIQIIEKTIVRQIYYEASNNEQLTINKKESESVVKEIIREIQSLPSDTLAALDSRISDLDSKLGTLNFELSTFSRTTPTIIQLPPSNTKGVGDITLNPQKVDTETLSVSSSATLSSLTVDNNATISGNLTVSGTTTFSSSASISASFELTSSSSRLGVNPGNTTNTMFEVGGTASISGALTLNNITYTFPSTQTASKFLQTDGSGSLSWATAGVSSNSLDFDEFRDTMLLDADLTINRNNTYKIGIGQTPSTVFEVQGTSSASYLLTGNTLQVGGYSSVSYSRFGTGTTTHAGTISGISDLLVSGGFEVNGSAAFDGFALFGGSASVSNRFELTSSSARLGINAGVFTDTMLEVGGTASISGALTLNNITYTFPSTQTANKFLQTDGSGSLSWATAGVSSNSLDFDEFVDTMLLDTDLTINRGGYKIGIGSSPSTVFEVQGTSSASYLLTGNTIQVGGYSSAAYSRFGTGTTTHAGTISGANDLLVSGGFEVNGSAAFDGFALFSAGASVSTNFEITGNNRMGINAGPVTSTNLEVGGTASISGTLTLNNVTYTMPSADGSNGQVLSTNGSGALSWVTKTEGTSQDFKGLSLRTHPNADVAATTVYLDHADEIVMDTGNRVATWDDLSAVITTAGAGGLDTGSEAASTWYEIYAIRKSSDGTKNLLLHRAKDYFLDESMTTATDGPYSLRRVTAPTRTKLAQSFDTDVTGNVEIVDIDLSRAGAVSGRVWFTLEADSAGSPSGTPLATSDKIDASLIATSEQWIRFPFRTPTSLTATTTYWLVLQGDYTESDTVVIRWHAKDTTNPYAAGTGKSFDGGSWTTLTNTDFAFKLYVTENDTSVTMPTGYDQKAKIGYVYNNSSSNFEKFIQQDHGVQISEATNYVGTISATILTIQDLSAILPPTAVTVETSVESSVSGDAAGIGNSLTNEGYAWMGGANLRAPAGQYAIGYQHIYFRRASGTGNIYLYVQRYTWGSSGGADLAEEYLVDDDSVVPGDVVSLTDRKFYIDKAVASSSWPAFGIVSTKPGIVLKDWSYNPQNTRNVALSGRVPVKISEENGIINVGDRLTLSKTIPGYAMRQTEPGQSIGIALESSSRPDLKILAFVNLSYWSPDLNQLLTQEEQINTASGSTQNLSTSYTDTLFKIIVKRFSSLYDIVFEKGLMKVANIVADKITADTGTFKKFELSDEDTGQTYCVKMKSGQLISTSGGCDNVATPSSTSESTPEPTSEVTPEPTSDVTTSSTSEVSEPTSDVATPEPTPEIPTE